MTHLNANASCPLAVNLSRRRVMAGLTGSVGALALTGSGIGIMAVDWPGRAPVSRLEKLLLARTQAHADGIATLDTLRNDSEGPIFSDLKTALLQELA